MIGDITTTPGYKWAEFYEQVVVGSIMRYWTPLLLSRAAAQPGERVLDVACGTGTLTRAIAAQVGPREKVAGLDISPASVAFASAQACDYCDAIEWRQGRAEDLPFPDDDFDLVTCQQGVQFFEDRPKAAREMRRVLRREGRVVIAVWQSFEGNPFQREVYSAIASVYGVPLSSISLTYSLGDPLELRDLLRDAGFRQVSVEPVAQDCRYEPPVRVLEHLVDWAITLIPPLAQLDAESAGELRPQVRARVADLVEAHTSGGVVTFPWRANIATGLC